MRPHYAIFVLSSFSNAARTQQAPKSKDAILLSKVASLTLKSDGLTTGRRSKPIPQLTCSGPACRFHKLETLRCTNAGTGYGDEDIQWTCTADLPAAFKLGSTDVQCEGYRSPDDDYVLRGSCGVNYRLLFTQQGESQYAEELASANIHAGISEGSQASKYAFLLLFVGVLGWIVYNAYLRASENRRSAERPTRRPGGGGGGGGGGGWGPGGGGGGGWGSGHGDDDAPPPYTPRHTKAESWAPQGGRAQRGWGFGSPGFWTGALGGAAAGYAAGSRRSRDDGGRAGGWGAGGSSGSPGRFGGSSGGPSFASSSSSSGRTYESTGFGGTSRR